MKTFLFALLAGAICLQAQPTGVKEKQPRSPVLDAISNAGSGDSTDLPANSALHVGADGGVVFALTNKNVANDTARFLLSPDSLMVGTVVTVNATNRSYMLIDPTNIANESGWHEVTSGGGALQLRHGTASEIASSSALLAELIYSTDTGEMYVGDGSGSAVPLLPSKLRTINNMTWQSGRILLFTGATSAAQIGFSNVFNAGGSYLSLNTTTAFSLNGSGHLDLSNTGVTAGSYGGSDKALAITVDAKGRVSSVTEYNASGGGGSAAITPRVAYVVSGGDDGTAELGNAGKPYSTVQAAYTALSSAVSSSAANLTVASNVATISIGAAHGAPQYTYVFVAGAPHPNLNGWKRNNSNNANTITYTTSGVSNGTYSPQAPLTAIRVYPMAKAGVIAVGPGVYAGVNMVMEIWPPTVAVRGSGAGVTVLQDIFGRGANGQESVISTNGAFTALPVPSEDLVDSAEINSNNTGTITIGAVGSGATVELSPGMTATQVADALDPFLSSYAARSGNTFTFYSYDNGIWSTSAYVDPTPAYASSGTNGGQAPEMYVQLESITVNTVGSQGGVGGAGNDFAIGGDGGNGSNIYLRGGDVGTVRAENGYMGAYGSNDGARGSCWIMGSRLGFARPGISSNPSPQLFGWDIYLTDNAISSDVSYDATNSVWFGKQDGSFDSSGTFPADGTGTNILIDGTQFIPAFKSAN